MNNFDSFPYGCSGWWPLEFMGSVCPKLKVGGCYGSLPPNIYPLLVTRKD